MISFTTLLPYYSLLTLGQHPCKQLLPKQEESTVHILALKRKLLIYGYCGKEYDLPSVINELIQRFVYGDTFLYRNKKLPKDLSKQNLSGFDFRRCKFIDTNLMGTNLRGVILKDTSCLYHQHSTIRYIQSGFLVKIWWPDGIRSIPSSLKKISYLYTYLTKCSQKARLLHIASALAELYISFLKYTKRSYSEQSREVDVQMLYWFCLLFILKKEILREKIVEEEIIKEKVGYFPFEEGFNINIDLCCWKSKEPRSLKFLKENSQKHELPKSITEYARKFRKGLQKCKRVDDRVSKAIEKNIKALQEIYTNIQNKNIKRKIFKLAYLLSNSYRLSKKSLLECYLECQVKLVKVKRLTKKKMYLQNNIYIKPPLVPFLSSPQPSLKGITSIVSPFKLSM